MNVIDVLCSPFIEALSENEGFDIVVPKNSDCDLDNVLEIEMDDEIVQSRKSKVVRQLTDHDGCKAYAQIMAVSAFVLELKSDGRTVSLRDVYYALKGLFRNQKECNAIILEVGRVLKLKRHQMNIVPASKGFVSGHFRFRFRTPPSEEEMEQNEDEERDREDEEESQPMELVEPPTPTPAVRSTAATGEVSSWSYAFEPAQTRTATTTVTNTSTNSTTPSSGGVTGAGAAGCSLIGAAWTSLPANYIEMEWQGVTSTEPLWLLVVEKEGVFHRLLEERFPERMKCIMVTGCGYPDMATRALVSKLSLIYPRMRVVGLCDYNPHGLALLLTYRFPSVSSEYESQGLQADIRWLGLRAVHIREFGERSAASSTAATTSTISTNSTSSNSASTHTSTSVMGTRAETTTTTSSSSSISSSSFAREQLQELTLADTRKIRALLNSLNTQDLPLEYGQELHQMLIGGVKCEIESCYSLGLSFLPNFLERCLNNGDFI